VLWKLALVVVLPLLLYGRAGVFRHPLFRLLLPVSQPARRSSPTPRPPGQTTAPPKGWSRTYVALVVLAAVAIISWVVTRAVIGGPGR
jgi:hypothetical protein